MATMMVATNKQLMMNQSRVSSVLMERINPDLRALALLRFSFEEVAYATHVLNKV